MTHRLILVRHGESVFNAQNRFTGWRDIELSPRGEAEARHVGALLAQNRLRLEVVFSSALARASRSARLILEELNQRSEEIIVSAALNERDYGQLTGLDKDEARSRWGEEQVRIWRRSYDVAPPGGESLRDTVARVVTYYVQAILPAAMNNQAVLVVAHGNTLRALTFVLDGITPTAIEAVEFPTGAVLVYELAADTRVARRRLLEGTI